jgi:hypothetical protein
LRDAIVETVRSNLEGPRGTIIVTTEPPGLEVRCDGHAFGKTPLERREVAGSHVITVTALSGEESRQEIDLTADARLPVDFNFAPKPIVATPTVAKPSPAPLPPETWTPRNLKVAGWTLVGASIVGVVVGASLLGINGHEIGRHTENNLLVADVYNTGAAGGAVIGLAAAIGLASAAPFYLAKKKDSVAKVKAMIGPSGAHFAVEGRW